MIAAVRRWINRNRGTTLMIVFTAGFYAALTLPDWKAPHPVRERPSVAQQRQSDQELRQREERFQKTLEANPRLYGSLAMLFSAAVLLALLADVILIVRRIRKGHWIAGGEPQEDVPWDLSAVVRIFVLLFFLEAVILVLEMIVSLFVDMRSINRDLLLMANSLARDMIAALALVWIIAKGYRVPLSRVGLTARRFFANVRTGLVGYVAIVPALLVMLFVMALVAKQFSYEPPAQPVVQMYIRESAPRALMFFTVFVAVFGPVMEELFFRGFAYKALRTRYGVRAAMAVTAFFFALMHMSLIAFLPIFFLGLFLNYLYEKTGSLVPGMAAHMAHNLIMVGCTLAFKSLSG